MTPKRFLSAVLCYCFASLVCVPFALALAEFGRGYGLTFRPAFLGLWSLAVGAPSVGWSASKLASTLGWRPGPVLRVRRGGLRSIPIGNGRAVSDWYSGNVLADNAKTVLPAPARRVDNVQVADELEFICGHYVFSERELLPVLQAAWRRQSRREPPLSRRYWLNKPPFDGDGQKYQAFCDALVAAGILIGRCERRSGRLVTGRLFDLHYIATG